MYQEYTYPGCLVTQAMPVCTITPNIFSIIIAYFSLVLKNVHDPLDENCGSSVWNLLMLPLCLVEFCNGS